MIRGLPHGIHVGLETGAPQMLDELEVSCLLEQGEAQAKVEISSTDVSLAAAKLLDRDEQRWNQPADDNHVVQK